jgi:hypothetical protein
MFHVPTPENHRGDGGTEYPQMAQMDTDEKTDEEDDGPLFGLYPIRVHMLYI